MTDNTTTTMTDRQMESLRWTLYAELQLPQAPDFAADGRGGFVSQVYGPPSGFMNKFIEGYHVTLRARPVAGVNTLFDTTCDVTVNYQHGKWERHGSNGVSTTLFHAVKLNRWVDADTASTMHAETMEGANR
jgi:hypothetical protein